MPIFKSSTLSYDLKEVKETVFLTSRRPYIVGIILNLAMKDYYDSTMTTVSYVLMKYFYIPHNLIELALDDPRRPVLQECANTKSMKPLCLYQFGEDSGKHFDSLVNLDYDPLTFDFWDKLKDLVACAENIESVELPEL